MRTVQTLVRVITYSALWVAIVLVCTVIGALTATIGVPASWDSPGRGVGMFVNGWWGFFIGTGVATVIVMLVIERRKRPAHMVSRS